jgi:hypothetical protein
MEVYVRYKTCHDFVSSESVVNNVPGSRVDWESILENPFLNGFWCMNRPLTGVISSTKLKKGCNLLSSHLSSHLQHQRPGNFAKRWFELDAILDIDKPYQAYEWFLLEDPILGDD